jgi:hypothetical protein
MAVKATTITHTPIKAERRPGRFLREVSFVTGLVDMAYIIITRKGIFSIL